MRPLRLTMRGFRSHHDETSIDFEGRTLLAIVGPTGAGKSTILDGISYALYATTPREKRSSRNLISTRDKKAAISYRFAVGDETYEINRSIPAASDDHIVAVDTGDKVIGSTGITAKVEELLGLDFEGFASSVLLAQGRFDQFLKAATTKRTEILKGIFRIEQIDDLRVAAKRRVDGLDDELNKIEGERRQIPDDAAEQVAAAKAEIKTLGARISDLEKGVPEEAALLEREKDAAKEKIAAEKEIVSLTEAVKKLPRAESIQELAERELTCATTTKEATSKYEASEKAVADATKTVEKVQTELGDTKGLHAARVQAEGLPKRVGEIDELTASISEAEKAVATAEAELGKIVGAEAEAKATLATARETVDELRAIHAAHTLRSTLTPGEPCPVCEQTVATIPRSKKVGDLDKAASAVVRAEAEAAKRAAVTTSAKSALAAEQQRAKSLVESKDKAVAALADVLAVIEKVVGKSDNPVGEIDARLARLDTAIAERETALTGRQEAQKAMNECASVKQQLEKERQKHAGALIELSVKLGIPVPTFEDPAETLLTKIEAMSERAVELGEQWREQMDKAGRVADETGQAIAELRAKVGVEGALTDAVAEAKTQEAVKRHVVEDLTKKVARAKELAALEKELNGKRALFHQLADDLTDRHFVNFLLEDRRRLLSELASERLHEMTKRYRFTEDGEFNIVDELEGDVERGADTLSGGETFLASLSLALGLAETAARHGGRLQSFFLDEGFDSLDAEMLDLSLDGIERIVTSDRLIALVSHVPALAARVEDKIVLAKDAEGSTVVTAGAAR